MRIIFRNSSNKIVILTNDYLIDTSSLLWYILELLSFYWWLGCRNCYVCVGCLPPMDWEMISCVRTWLPLLAERSACQPISLVTPSNDISNQHSFVDPGSELNPFNLRDSLLLYLTFHIQYSIIACNDLVIDVKMWLMCVIHT